MSFRRSSSLSREDGLTLEQRLVMQLTAAMRHDDSMQAVEEHAGDAPPPGAAQHAAVGSAAHAGAHAGAHAMLPAGQHLDEHAHAHAHAPPHAHAAPGFHAAPPGHAQDLHSMDANELSTMLRTLGASLESLGSAIGGSSDTTAAGGAHEPAPHHGAPAAHAELSSGAHDAGHAPAHDHSLLSSLGALESLGSLSQLGGLGNLLSSMGMHEPLSQPQPRPQTASQAASQAAPQSQSQQPQPEAHHLGPQLDLGNLGLGSLAHLGDQHPAPSTHAHGDMRDSVHEDVHRLDAHAGPQHGAASLGPASAHLDTAAPDSIAAERRTPPPESAAAEHASLGLSQVEIDPDVSSIQSVLQSLLTAGSSGSSSGSSAGFATETAQPAAPDATGSAAAASSSQAEAAAAAEQDKDFEMPSLANFGLETEDQMLVDSLRSAIENQLSGAAAEPDASAARDDSASVDALRPSRAGRVAKSRTQSRAKKPRSESVLHADDFASSSFREESSDFGASDPDTLRAIQQALLSALGPSASSTSLTESLTESITSELKASTATEPAPAAADAAAAAHRQASTAARPELASELQPASAAQSASAKAAERILRAPAKKVAPKVTKPTERDRQKLREENAARKRRWREENVLQNRDNDLRARIIRRAQTMFGESESAQKAEWIEAEYQRRRQKRILRADINSLVANAMESARSRAASEQAAGHRVSGQRLTLTQQTRQIASNQLSELFRRSNAVLEPQLHSEKLSVPLAPYLLVPSPNRPPYKVEWKGKAASTAPAEGVVDKSKDASPATASGKDASKQSRDETSEAPASHTSELPEQAASSGAETAPGDTASVKEATERAPAETAPAETATAEAGPVEATPREATSQEATPAEAATKEAASAETSPAETGSTEAAPTEATTKATGLAETASAEAAHGETASQAASSAAAVSDARSPSDASPKAGPPEGPSGGASAKPGAGRAPFGDASAISMRPKHRYGLVGNAQLGVPPNLAAIYQKLTLRKSAAEQA